MREKKEQSLDVSGHPVVREGASEVPANTTDKASPASTQQSLELTHRRLSLPGHTLQGSIAGKHPDAASIPSKPQTPPDDSINAATETWEDAAESDATTEVPESEGVEEGAERD